MLFRNATDSDLLVQLPDGSVQVEPGGTISAPGGLVVPGFELIPPAPVPESPDASKSTRRRNTTSQEG